ncbi:hypothetical protein Bca52824_073852 [Brassica carinata]|uniref:Uncharacterized protein n=1 Tax=Brassica carinata TaxID=52824 RepID=A0A8X7QBU7_BRACI|nr:hypothetical protein Bca52824_073852 [Brassica carinata]
MAGQTDPHISLFSPHDVLLHFLFVYSNANASVVAVALKRRGKCTHDKPEADADADTRSSSRQPREASNEPRVKSIPLPMFFPV